MTSDLMATFIKVAAILSASTRWIVALFAAEGLPAPEGVPWGVVSFIAAAVMSVVEGLGFNLGMAYWRKMSGRYANTMLVLLVVSAVVFVGVLTPSIVAQARHTTIGAILADGPLYVWSAGVALSTIMLVAMIGYGQKIAPIKGAETKTRATAEPVAHHGSTNGSEPAHQLTRMEYIGVWRKADPELSDRRIALDNHVPPTTARRWVKGLER